MALKNRRKHGVFAKGISGFKTVEDAEFVHSLFRKQS